MLITIKNAQIQQKNYKKHTDTQTRTQDANTYNKNTYTQPRTQGEKMLIHTTKTLTHEHALRVERC